MCTLCVKLHKPISTDDDAPSYGRIRCSYGQPTPLSIASTGAVHCIDPRLGYPRSPAILVAAYALIDTLFPSVDDDGLRWVYPRLASGKPTQSPSNGNSPSTPRRYGVGEALAAAIAAEGDDAIALVPHFTKKCAKFIPAQVGILGLHLRIMAMAVKSHNTTINHCGGTMFAAGGDDQSH